MWQTSPMGPFDNWPSGGGGFEHFYGFIGGETNQYAPAIYDGTTPVEPDRTPEEGYHFTEDMTDHAIDWVRQQKALMPDKPFFVYYAPGATHAPHHVPPEWSAKYRGRFDAGWDALREETFARQKELGVVPADAELTARPDEIPAWDDMPDDLKPVLARQMEVYAGFLEHTDHHVGRLIDALADLEVLDDTLVYVIIGDNGASGRGHAQRLLQRAARASTAPPALETAGVHGRRGSTTSARPKAYNHYAVGWAHAMDTPYQWTKQVASHWGGTRNGTIVHWPDGHRGQGRDPHQFHHVIDVAADGARGGRAPGADVRARRAADAAAGRVSMAYSFDDAAAAERHETQYFEMFCNRGIYHKGWTAVTRHSTPWVMAPSPPFDDDVWELYAPDDWTQAHDLAAEQPEKLRRAAAAVPASRRRKYNVLPLDDRRVERFNSDLAGRPQLDPRQPPDAVRRDGPADRELVVVHQEQVARRHRADRRARRRRHGRDRRPGRRLRRLEPLRSRTAARPTATTCSACSGSRSTATTVDPAPASTRCGWSSPTTAAGSARAERRPSTSTATKVGEGRVDATVPMVFSADETTDVGSGQRHPRQRRLRPARQPLHRARPLGQIDLGEDAQDADHLITPEERLRVAMARQ